MGTFFKQIYRYTHPRAYRHNENLWPYVKISRASTGEINSLIYKKQPVPVIALSELKGAFAGEILLTATGPSVKEIAFEKLPDMPAFGVNGSYYLNEKVNFSFYLIVDMGFIDERPDIVQKVIADDQLILFTTVHGIVRILDKFSLNSVKCRLSVIEDISCKVFQPKISHKDLFKSYSNINTISFSGQEIGFNSDICYGIFDAGTVIYWSFQLLLFLGFNFIYIIGLDMNNFDQPRFYENPAEKQPSMLSHKLHDIIIPSFRHASKIMQENKITVLNLSVMSAIDEEIFKKANYNELF